MDTLDDFILEATITPVSVPATTEKRYPAYIDLDDDPDYQLPLLCRDRDRFRMNRDRDMS